MNNKPYVIVQCIITNNGEFIHQLSTALNDIVKKMLPQVKISVESNAVYWKFPKCNTITYSVCDDKPIMVHEFIKMFDLAWHYTENMARDSESGKRYNNEEAIWNQNCHPTEVFLIPQVEWVHIYTWVE
jgi:hypothetical protein